MPYTPEDSAAGRSQLSQQEEVNQLIRRFPESSYQRLVPYFVSVKLKLGQILHEPGEPITTVYFPHQAMVSLVQVMENGSTIEAGIVGNDGVVGYAVFLGGVASASRAVVQLPGHAIALDANLLKDEFDHSSELRSLLLRYSQALIAQISQTAACNRFHAVEERLARWLLQSHDASQSSDLELTQDFLSSMLGTRRASVTQAAGKLQQAGLIRCSRGRIEIVDREALRGAACECYLVTRAEFARLLEI